MLNSKALKAAEAFFAREQPIYEPLSHLNTVLLAVLLRSPRIFADYFPEMVTNAAIEKLIRQLKSRGKR